MADLVEWNRKNRNASFLHLVFVSGVDGVQLCFHKGVCVFSLRSDPSCLNVLNPKSRCRKNIWVEGTQRVNPVRCAANCIKSTAWSLGSVARSRFPFTKVAALYVICTETLPTLSIKNNKIKSDFSAYLWQNMSECVLRRRFGDKRSSAASWLWLREEWKRLSSQKFRLSFVCELRVIFVLFLSCSQFWCWTQQTLCQQQSSDESLTFKDRIIV